MHIPRTAASLAALLLAAALTIVSAPTAGAALAGAKQLAAGNGHTCAIVAKGAVVCWGGNNSGQLGDGTTEDSATPVQVKGPAGAGHLTGAKQLTAGAGHTCAIVKKGAVVCWGGNIFGQLGDGTDEDSLTPVAVVGVSGAKQVAAGEDHTCAIVKKGAVMCWGTNSEGQLGDGTNQDSTTPVQVNGPAGAGHLTGAKRLSANTGHTCATVTKGALACWGYNGEGQLGDGTQDVHLAPVHVVGSTGVGQLTGAKHPAVGHSHTCATVSKGALVCWGSNTYGQLGNNSDENSSVPVPVG